MGHDIFGNNKAGEEIAYLRRNAWSGQVHAFYRAIGCSEFDGGCSGIGKEVVFKEGDLKDILEYFPKDLDDDFREFLEKCLKCAKEEEIVVIYFG